MALSGWSVNDLIDRLSPEQVDYVLDSVKSELTHESGTDVNLAMIITSLVEDIAEKVGRPIHKYLKKKDSVAASDEEIAVEAILRAEINHPYRHKFLYSLGLPPKRELKKMYGRARREDLMKVTISPAGPLPTENLEVLKELIKKAALRKLKEMEPSSAEATEGKREERQES